MFPTDDSRPAPAAGATPLKKQPVPADLAEIVRQQFGDGFVLATHRTDSTVKYLHPPKETDWVMFLTGDLDGDNIEDAVIVARNPKPLDGQGKYGYKVIDPYFTYHGYGDPKITSTMMSEDPTQQSVVLIIHGAGAEGWRAAKPKSKFVAINLPFDSLSFSQVKNRKKMVPALNLASHDTSSSVIYWDGKKYRWRETAGLAGL